MNYLEPMADFFTARVEGYDEHMLNDVEGCKEGYERMAGLVPQNTTDLLDLGCGTGLELDAIFRRLPELKVTGVDMTRSMLDKLQEKHPEKSLNLICGDYFVTEFGTAAYDCCVSFETMHHFTHEKKTELYSRIWTALRENGCYIECDYMVETQEEEDHWFAENDRIRREQGIPVDAFYHYDTPCSVENQVKMLHQAGFSTIEHVFQIGGTHMLIAYK